MMDASLGEACTERLELDEGSVPIEGVFMLTFPEKPEDVGELDMRISMRACSRFTRRDSGVSTQTSLIFLVP